MTPRRASVSSRETTNGQGGKTRTDPTRCQRRYYGSLSSRRRRRGTRWTIGLRPAAPLTCCTRENTAGKNKGGDDNDIVPFTTVIVAAHRSPTLCRLFYRRTLLSTERLGENIIIIVDAIRPLLSVSIVRGRVRERCCGDVTTDTRTRTGACTRERRTCVSHGHTLAFSAGRAYLPTGGGPGDLRTPATWVWNTPLSELRVVRDVRRPTLH